MVPPRVRPWSCHVLGHGHATCQVMVLPCVRSWSCHVSVMVTSHVRSWYCHVSSHGCVTCQNQSDCFQYSPSILIFDLI